MVFMIRKDRTTARTPVNIGYQPLREFTNLNYHREALNNATAH
jgi:hypothetical protein